jgi:flagellin-like hook-associated protein FlgL
MFKICLMKENSNEDLTRKTPNSDSEKLNLILTIVKKLESQGAAQMQIIDRLDKLTARLDAVETRLDAVETRLEAVETRLTSIEDRLLTMERTIRRSVHESRPGTERSQ